MNIDNVTKALIEDEGVRYQAYQDSLGYWTIGVGRLIDARKQGSGLSDEEVRYLLKNDIVKAVALLNANIPWWTQLNDARQEVLINMTFNLGIAGLMGFKNTLAKIKAGDYEGAAEGMLASKWAAQVKGRANRLAERMRTGV